MKSPAPFMSLNPSGSIFGLLTASRWKGRPYISGLVTPSNPSPAGPITARLYLGSLAKACRAVLTSAADVEKEGSLFFQDARDGAPSGQSWISWLQRYAKDVYDKTITHWATLDGTETDYFENEAASIGLADYTPTLGGVAQTGLTAGQQLMALGFFGQDYIENAICQAAVENTSPSEGEVQALGAYVNDTTHV